MGSLPDDLVSSSFSSTSDIESSNNIFFLYHNMGLALGHSHKSLLLMYMYTKSFAQFDINWFFILLWTNEYELQFRLHDDVEHTWTKMQWTMGVNVHPPIVIKSHHSYGSKSRSFIGGCQKQDLNFRQNLQSLLKLRHKQSGTNFFHKIMFKTSFAFASSCRQASSNKYGLKRVLA
jgi:hypothetical protein